jgi:putative hemolysin
VDSSLVLLILLIALSGAFSGAEIALTSISLAKATTLKESKHFGAKAVFKLKKKPQSTLIAILIGNNLVNILATVVATIWGIETFGSNAIGIVTGILTFVVLVFGEITPKTIAQKYAVSFACTVSYPLLGLIVVLYPVIWILNKFIGSMMRIFNVNNPIGTISEEELLAMVDIGTKEGIIEEHEQEFIENVLEFTDTTAEEIMTIEKDIEAIEINSTIKDSAHFFVQHSHTRIPVYKNDINNIVGIVTVHDILSLLHDSKEIKTLADLHYQPVIVVPKTKSINKLFREFQKRRQHLAIVVDEHGMTVGIVTLEDILEEIVGDIADEKDREEDGIYSIGKNEWEVEGDTTIEEINEALKTELDYPEHQTISLLILEELQGFPHKGEKITYENLTIQVKEMGKNKIEKVLITKTK